MPGKLPVKLEFEFKDMDDAHHMLDVYRIISLAGRDSHDIGEYITDGRLFQATMYMFEVISDSLHERNIMAAMERMSPSEIRWLFRLMPGLNKELEEVGFHMEIEEPSTAELLNKVHFNLDIVKGREFSPENVKLLLKAYGIMRPMLIDKAGQDTYDL